MSTTRVPVEVMALLLAAGFLGCGTNEVHNSESATDAGTSPSDTGTGGATEDSGGDHGSASLTCGSRAEHWRSLDMTRFYAGGLLVDDSGFFVMDRGAQGLWQIVDDGKQVTPLIPPTDALELVTARLRSDATHVYWGTRDSHLYRAAKSAGDRELIANHEDDDPSLPPYERPIRDIHVDGTRVLYVTHRALRHVPVAGGTPTVIQQDGVDWCSADQSAIYWRQEIDEGVFSLRKQARGQEAVEDLGVAPGHSLSVRHYGDYIYRMQGVNLIRISTYDGLAEYVANLPEANDTAFDYVVDDGDVFWTSSAGAAWRVAMSPSNAPVAADPTLIGQMGPFDEDDYNPMLARWNDRLYWQAGLDPDIKISDGERIELFRDCSLD